MKSPFTLKKYQTRYSNGKSTSSSTPVTPHFQKQPRTPSSTHSCASSSYTTSSGHSKARKSLASLIADTESCSSSLKDLNFDTDSGTDSKENTPMKQTIRRSTRKQKMTPKFASFKGVLEEKKKNLSSSITNLEEVDILSPTKMLKTPQCSTDVLMSPPKVHHSRRSNIEVAESPDSEKSHKRLRHDSSLSETGPNPKCPKLESTAPKARLSLFTSDRLKEILSVKSFYGKSDPELNTSSTAKKIANAVYATATIPHKQRSNHSYRRKPRRLGQINMGVRHRIRKPKINHIKGKLITPKIPPSQMKMNPTSLNSSFTSNQNLHNTTMISEKSSQDDLDTGKYIYNLIL